jgi:hypothetical protein
MRLTIIPIDNLVGVDGQFFSGLNLSECNIPANIHALQWYEDNGEVEFIDNPDRTKPMNELISKLPAWALNAKTTWDAAKATQDAALLAAQEADAIPVTEV